MSVLLESVVVCGETDNDVPESRLRFAVMKAKHRR